MWCWNITAFIYWIQETLEIVAECKLLWRWNTLFSSFVHIIWRMKKGGGCGILCLSLVKLLPFTCSWSWKCECMFINFDCWDSSFFVSMHCNSDHLNYLKSSIPWMLTHACVLASFCLTGYTELCVELSVTTLHVRKGLLSKFVTNFSDRIIQIVFKFSMVSSLPFWRLLHDTNIITNAELNCPHNIIQFGENCLGS